MRVQEDTVVKRRMLLAMAAALALPLAACSSGAANSGDGTRTVEVRAFDSLRFEPMEVQVEAGETVRFVVSNPGSLEHEFVLGDEDVQMAHEGQMDMGMEHGSIESELPSLTIAPGETKTVAVTFDEPGTVLYGCHVEGHYDGGMVGTIDVS